MKLKYILPKKILKNSDFIDPNLVLVFNKKNIVLMIILHLYKLNTQIY